MARIRSSPERSESPSSPTRRRSLSGYRTSKNKERSVSVKIRDGAGTVTLPKGSKKIHAKAKATTKLRTSKSVSVTAYVAPVCPGGQWLAKYYPRTSLTGSYKTRCDAALDFDWGLTSPMSTIPKDRFSVRWTTTREFPAGSWQFTATADDGIRVKVDDGAWVINAWRDQDPTTHQATVPLTAGSHTVTVEYYEYSAGSVARASWTQLDTTAPAAPSDLVATAGDKAVSLRWTAPASSDATGYRVYRATSPGVVAATGSSLGGASATSFTDSTVSNGTRYYYLVTAVDAAGNESPASNETSATPLEQTPPTVSSRQHAANATGVPVSAGVAVTFSEPVAAASVTTSTLTLSQGGSAVPAAVTLSADATTATLVPDADLAGETSYTVTVRGGPAGVRDLAGNPLAADTSWSFATTDIAVPTVLIHQPAENATGVALDANVTVTLSEPPASATSPAARCS